VVTGPPVVEEEEEEEELLLEVDSVVVVFQVQPFTSWQRPFDSREEQEGAVPRQRSSDGSS